LVDRNFGLLNPVKDPVTLCLGLKA